MPTPEAYEIYKAARYDQGYTDPECPGVAKRARLALEATSRQAAFTARVEAIKRSLDFTPINTERWYLPHLKSGFAAPEGWCEANGFDPSYLQMEVKFAYDTNSDPVGAMRESGFAVDAIKDDWRRPSHVDEDEWSRPNPYAVLVDIGGRRDRDKRWVYPEQESYWFPAWDVKRTRREAQIRSGMSKQVFAEVVQRRLRAAAQSAAKTLEEYANENRCDYIVLIEVLWRRQVIGSASLGNVSLLSLPWGAWCARQDAEYAEVASAIADVEDEALQAAIRWADQAVDETERKAAKLVQSIARLPQRSLDAVRARDASGAALADAAESARSRRG